MRMITIYLIAGIMLASLYTPAWCQGGQGVQLTASAEVEVKIPDAHGRLVVRRIPAEKVLPGSRVIYTIHYSNTGNLPAERVAITNPIPEHMRYQAESAFGFKAAVTFSIDGGKTFDRPDKLFILDQTGKSLPANAADYTHIRWTLEQSIAPQATGQVGFMAALE